ncbi:MAG: arsenic resistance N-acetyltransferase ArsN2 [Woeseiaceae bacterium]|nr:arsenic resistance N-acetyltransferase ArsN2 [Woeseiaceae bacterium]
MQSELKVRPAEFRDIPTCIEFLEEAGLPTADVSLDRIALIAEVDGSVAGLIGLEKFGDTGLLRSLVVDNRYRKSGFGRQLVGKLEQHAQEQGIERLWLLTIDADGYFERFGYRQQERAAAPPAIRATDEFAELCPDDAVLMMKSLPG